MPGILGVIVFGYYSLVDWSALQTSYTHYEQAERAGADVKILFALEADQNIHRINLFAEGVWALLSALIVAVGLGGLTNLTR